MTDYSMLTAATEKTADLSGETGRLKTGLPTLAAAVASIVVAASVFAATLTPAMARAVRTADEVAGAGVTTAEMTAPDIRATEVVRINPYRGVPTLTPR